MKDLGRSVDPFAGPKPCWRPDRPPVRQVAEYFHAVIAGREITSMVTGSVNTEGVFAGQSWPPPDEVLAIEAEFRDSVRETRPELEDQMWGPPDFVGLKMTRESGELRMQLLDEYLASR